MPAKNRSSNAGPAATAAKSDHGPILGQLSDSIRQFAQEHMEGIFQVPVLVLIDLSDIQDHGGVIRAEFVLELTGRHDGETVQFSPTGLPAMKPVVQVPLRRICSARACMSRRGGAGLDLSVSMSRRICL